MMGVAAGEEEREGLSESFRGRSEPQHSVDRADGSRRADSK